MREEKNKKASWESSLSVGGVNQGSVRKSQSRARTQRKKRLHNYVSSDGLLLVSRYHYQSPSSSQQKHWYS